jgi:hypothetical protein
MSRDANFRFEWMKKQFVFALLALFAATSACSFLSPGPKSSSGEFEGYYSSGFEVSSFVPCGETENPDYGAGYWLTSSPDFYQQYSDLVQQSGHDPATGYLPVYTRFEGELSSEGSYGHMGAYSHEITVTKTIEMSLDGTCP